MKNVESQSASIRHTAKAKTVSHANKAKAVNQSAEVLQA